MSGLTVGDVFRNAARAVPHRPAAALDDAVLTFAEIDARADATAHALAARGIRRGDRVVCWTGTDLDVVPLFAGLARLGAVYCPLPANLGPDEALQVIEVAAPQLLVLDDASPGSHVRSGGFPVLRLSELTAASLIATEPYEGAVEEADPHVLFFTSGSTGRPKGVVLSHRVNCLRTHPGAQLEPRGAMVCVYPLFHMGAWTIALQQWQARDLVVFTSQTDGDHICRLVRRHRAERLNGVPAIWQRVLDALDGDTLPSIRFADSGTSTTPPELLAAIQAACPKAHLRVFYGSTEAGNVAALVGDDIARKPFSCGVPSGATEVNVDPDSGELLVRGPLLFDGYYGNPEATAAALQDGWYRTGDLAEVDADGYLRIVGRAHDLIRTGGEAVAPAEVEVALAGLPGVVEHAVVGLPDDRWGEVVCLAVVLGEGAAAPSLDLVRDRCGSLAAFKRPRVVRVVAELPRTPATGQVQRRQLVKQLSHQAS